MQCILTQTDVPQFNLFYHCLYVSQGESCCVKPIVVLHLTVDGCNSYVYHTYSYDCRRRLGPEVM